MMKKIRQLDLKVALLFAVLLCLAVKAQGANFNCKKPQSAFEHLACGEIVTTIQGNEKGLMDNEQKELAKVDDELNAVYKEAMAKHFDPALLRREQRAWLKIRERCSQDDNCQVLALYDDRIYYLRYDIEHPPQSEDERESARLLSMGTPSGDNYTFDQGAARKGYGCGLCETLVRWFNHITPKGDMICEYRIARKMPGVIVPAWQELDITQHEALFRDVLRYEDKDLSEEKIRRLFVELRARGDKLWMVREDVYHLPDNKTETIVWHQTHTDGPSCALDGGYTVIALDDLSGVDKGASLYKMNLGGMLLYYKGKPFFLRVSGGSVFVRSSYVTCEINNY